jgi:GT2 family glycosyltransferase
VSEPVLSIVTGTRNRPDAIARMVRSIVEHTDLPFELLVADASDQQGGFGNADPRVQVISEPEPLGPPRGYNILFRRARAPWVCWLNDDVEVPPGWGAGVLASIERNPEVDHFCLPVVERGESEALVLLYWGIPYACMGLVRREAGEAVGWFDEGYSFYATEPDLALRLIESGSRLAPALDTHVLHHRRPDEARVSNRESFARDNARFECLWRPRRNELRRRYRRTSFRYFRGLEVCRSEAWASKALVVPMLRGEARPPRSARRHHVKAPGWWLGI